MMNLRGFLSSPTGGGIRHGLDLTDGKSIQINEARLHCNLNRSYVTYLITSTSGCGLDKVLFGTSAIDRADCDVGGPKR